MSATIRAFLPPLDIDADNDAMMPLSWSIRLDRDPERFIMAVSDLEGYSRPPLLSVSLICEQGSPLWSTQVADFDDDDPEGLADRILDRLIGKLQQLKPDEDVRRHLHKQMVEWIVAARTAAAQAR